MSIKIEPYIDDHIVGVRKFNSRLEKGGSSRKFSLRSISAWLPRVEGRDIYQEYFLALEGDSAIRGGYELKHQTFLIQNESRAVAFISNPISEGIVNKKYSLVGLQLIRDAQKKQPFLFALGMGGYSQPLPQVLKAMGWTIEQVPFYFRVVSSRNFLNNIMYLRNSATKRVLIDFLKLTGIGKLGINLIQTINQKRKSGADSLSFDVIPSFGSWAAHLWEACYKEYSLIAVRDSKTLNILYPESDSRFLKIRVSLNNEVIGWAVALDTSMKDSKQFGDMRVGTIIDCLASRENSLDVVTSATRLLENRGVDLTVSNQSCDFWCESLKNSGFIRGPSNFLIGMSSKASEALSPFEINKRTMHFVRGDGDGPVNL